VWTTASWWLERTSSHTSPRARMRSRPPSKADRRSGWRLAPIKEVDVAVGGRSSSSTAHLPGVHAGVPIGWLRRRWFVMVRFTLTPLDRSRWMKVGMPAAREASMMGRFARIFEPGYLWTGGRLTRSPTQWSLRHRPIIIVAGDPGVLRELIIVQHMGGTSVPMATTDTTGWWGASGRDGHGGDGPRGEARERGG